MLAGCWGPTNPHTSFGINPWSKTFEFYDSKDNDVLVENLEIDATGRTGKLGKLTIVNAASPVRLANVQQMDAYARQMQVMGSTVVDIVGLMPSILSETKGVIAELKAVRTGAVVPPQPPIIPPRLTPPVATLPATAPATQPAE